MFDPSVQRALDEMAADDPRRAELAGIVAGGLIGDGLLDDLSYARVLQFAWWGMPTDWTEPPEFYDAMLVAGADLFDRLDLPRYADVFRSPLTEEILAAHAESLEAGQKAYLAAYARSGVDAEVGDFAWSANLRPHEYEAFTAAEHALEAALDSGELKPGTSGWKATSARIIDAALDTEHPHLPGQTHRTAVLTERLQAWLSQTHGRAPRLDAMRSRHVKRFLHPLPVPDDVAERMEPVLWFLASVAAGARLTPAGHLPTAMVRDAFHRFGYGADWSDTPPRSSSEVTQLVELDMLLRRLGMVRRRKGELVLGSAARPLLDDSASAWRVVAAGLSAPGWSAAVAEVVAYLVLDGQTVVDALEQEAADILAEAGWHAVGGGPPDPDAVQETWYDTYRPLAALGGIVEGTHWRTLQFTDFGTVTLLEQIRATATGPVTR